MTEVELPESVQSMLDSIPDYVDKKGRIFTKEEDQLITYGWPRKRKADLAKLLGCSESTLRKRYEELKNNGI